MSIDSPFVQDPDSTKAPMPSPMPSSVPATGSAQSDLDLAARQAGEATLRRGAAAARVAKYFKHRWPDRAAGDFSKGQPEPERYRSVRPSTSLAAGLASNDEDPGNTQARHDGGVIEALHAAENEGWKSVSPPAPSCDRRPSPPRRPGVRRPVHQR
jgi:hypothetical protein